MTNIKNIETILNEVYEDFDRNETTYGEPQAFIELPNGRSIEVVEEREGLDEENYFYSLRLNCTEEEFDNYHGTCGLIDKYYTDEVKEEELILGIKYLFAVDKSVPLNQ